MRKKSNLSGNKRFLKKTKKFKRKNKTNRKMKGGKSITERNEAVEEAYSKSELMKRVKNKKKMKGIGELVPVMNKLKEQIMVQLDTFEELNKILGNYFTKKKKIKK